MSAKATREFLDGYGKPSGAKPRTTRPTHINTVTCPRCLGARVILFQWFGEQACPECDGTGESDE